MEYRHRRYFNRIIFFSLKCKMSDRWVKSETRPPPLSSLLPIYYTCDLLLFCTFIAQEVKPWVRMDGKWPNFSNNRPHSTAVFPSCRFCWRFNVRFSCDIFKYYPNFVPCYLSQVGYMAAGVSLSVSLTVSKNDTKIHQRIFVKFSRNVDNSARNRFQFRFKFEKITGCNCGLNSCLRAAVVLYPMCQYQNQNLVRNWPAYRLVLKKKSWI